MSARYQRGRRYPTSKEAFDKLPYGEQWEIKVNLLTDNCVFLEESLNEDCVRDLVASRALSSSEEEKVFSRVRYDSRQEGMRELLKMLPRCGGHWWRSLDDSLQKRGRYEQYYRLKPWVQEGQHGASGEPSSPPPPSLPQGPADDDKFQGADVQAILGNPQILLAMATVLTRMTDPRGAQTRLPGSLSVNESQQNVSREEASARLTQWNVSNNEDNALMGTALNDKKDAMMTNKDESDGSGQSHSAPSKTEMLESPPEESTQPPGSSTERFLPHRQLCPEIAQSGPIREKTDSSFPDRSGTGSPEEELDSMPSIVENYMQPSTATNAATRRPSEDKTLNTATPSAERLLGTLQQDHAQALTKFTTRPEAQSDPSGDLSEDKTLNTATPSAERLLGTIQQDQAQALTKFTTRPVAQSDPSGDPDDTGRVKGPSPLKAFGVTGEDGQERESLLEDGVTEQVSMLTNDNGRELLSSLHSDPGTILPSVPLPSAPLSAPASPLPSSGEVSVTATPMVSSFTFALTVNGPVGQVNVAKRNKITKHVSRSGISGNAQGGWEETEERGDPGEQDPYDDKNFTTSAEQSYQGSESIYYPVWNRGAQETALKEVCGEETMDADNPQEHTLDYRPCPGDAGHSGMYFVDLSSTRNTAALQADFQESTKLNTQADSCEAASLSACGTHADNDAASQQTEISATSEYAWWTAFKEGLQYGLSLLE